MAEIRPYVPPDRWRCEMCYGTGKRQFIVVTPETTAALDLHREGGPDEFATFTTEMRPCPACRGRGWNEWKGSPDARASAADFRPKS